MSCPWFKFWIFLCRRWWNSWWTSSDSSIRCVLFLSRLSKCPSLCPPRAARTVLCAPQLAEQLVDVPTLISFSSFQRTMEQHVDISVPRRGGRNAGLQGFLPEQSSTAMSSSLKRISERTVEQIVDIPSGGGLGQGSSFFAGPAEEDFTGVCRTFPHGKKCGVPGRSVRTCPRHACSWTTAAYEQSRGFTRRRRRRRRRRTRGACKS